ncbi:katanin p80 WD40 repeat-containing subunit B1-like isoform X1 [Panonychus citri]|uniref:katanin p80 WD40 repeat-containing subunit B1-like isoform X1 n=1 Tax=Panonychus citri TaxID=50023 RepID=UPI0023079268|nr:katanin p80 WD40 repeat-containing subunit B1-like isoform X1 [Panonychus citri]
MRFVAHNGPCTCLALGQKSGRVLVTGGDDKKVNLWAIGKPNILMSLSGHTTTIECVKFGHNEDLVCAGSVAGALKVWDLESVKLVRTLTGHRSAVKCIDFHPYGDFLASGSVDSNIKLWDIRKKGCMYTYKGHVKDVYCLKFSPDGRWLASGGDEGSVKLWDLPAGKLLAELKEHSAPVTDVCFHPNEFLLSSASSDGTIKFWDLETFQQVSTTTNDVGPIRKILYHPEGKTIFSAARDVLKIYGWEPTRTYDTVTMGWGKVNDIAISDNSLVASTFSLTNVSVFIVDLKKLQPFGSSSSSLSSSSFSSSSSNTINTNTTSSPSSSLSLLSPNNSNSSPLSTNTKLMPYRDSVSRQSTRKNFFHGNCSTTHSQLESLESNRSEETETGSDEPEGEESIDINNIYDTKEIFAPSRELCRTPPPLTSLAQSPSSMDSTQKLNELNLSSLSSSSPLSSYSLNGNHHNSNNNNNNNRIASGMCSIESLSSPTIGTLSTHNLGNKTPSIPPQSLKIPPSSLSCSSSLVLSSPTKMSTTTAQCRPNPRTNILPLPIVSPYSNVTSPPTSLSSPLSHHYSHSHPHHALHNNNHHHHASSHNINSSLHQHHSLHHDPVLIKQPVSTTTVNDSSLGYTAKISTSVIPPVTKATTPTSSSSSSIATLPLTKSSSTVLHTSRSMSNLSQKTAKSTNLVHPRQQPEVISIVRPVINDSKTKSHLNGSPSLINTNENHKNSNSMDNNHLHHSTKSVANNINNNNNNNNLHHHHHLNNNSKHQPRAAVVFPTEQQLHKQQPQSLDQIESPVDLIPEARDRPAGLDLDDFLPKHLQDTVRLGYHPQPEMSESEAMQAIIRGHKSVVTALSHRRKNLQIVLAMWSTKDARNALEQAINMEDQSVLVDILNVITLKPASWTLDMCQILVQPIYELLQSRYESYMTVGCSALKLILKNFATIIKTNITAPPGIGVDISREERYHKCMGVYNHLLNVRAFILKRQTLQGKLGRTFRELSILFQNLE